MALQHHASGEVIDVRPLGERLGESSTHTLVKSDTLEVIRLVVPEGKQIATHQVAGEITAQCLVGSVEFTADGTPRRLAAGDMLYLAPGTPHAVRGLDGASLLLTISLR